MQDEDLGGTRPDVSRAAGKQTAGKQIFVVMLLHIVLPACDCSSPSELPIWNFDGSSTGQAPGHDSEVLLRPVFICPDPFRGGDHKLVLCECIAPDMTPIPTNTRNGANAIFNSKLEEVPW